MRLMVLAVAVLVFSTVAQGAEAAPAPAHLTKQDVVIYQALKSYPDAARSFLDTRVYVRRCESVVHHQLAADKLGVKPDDYNSKYVTGPERKVVVKAVAMSDTALINEINIQ